MFEDVAVWPNPAYGDEELQRLLADPAALADWPPVLDGDTACSVPAEWLDGDPAAAYRSCAPSGWLALDLDTATTDPTALSDHTLIEAMIGFERLTSWAQARQARLFDELARRRPTWTTPTGHQHTTRPHDYSPEPPGPPPIPEATSPPAPVPVPDDDPPPF